MVMSQLKVRDLGDAPFGADIEGLDPSKELTADEKVLLQRTFDERGLLRFRNLDINTDQQRYLAALMIGREGPAPDGAPYDTSDEFFVSNKEDNGGAPFGRLLYHCDMMWSDNPFSVLTLYGLEVVKPSVPTVFASSVNAWTTLPDALRARVDGKHATHVTGQQRRGGDDDGGDLLQPIRENERWVTRPLPFNHPRTGVPLLYTSQMMTRNIEEYDAEESEALLEELFDHIYAPANSWQQDWEEKDLVMWDNFAIQHARGQVESDGPPRTLRKVISPRPIGVTERPTFSKAGAK
jgi:alpha-ketoglutarate-dependent taurine dioxygenase